MKEQNCLIPDCNSKQIYSRGLCKACHVYATTLVFHKLTTWEKMEKVGCIGPATGQIQSPKRPIRLDWFSRATGLTPDGLAMELKDRIREYTLNMKRRMK